MVSKKVLRMVALLLTMVMLFTACAGPADDGGKKEEASKPSTETSKTEEKVEEPVAESDYPEYLNTDGPYPIVKDEFKGTVKPKIMLVAADNALPWDELWFSKYLEAKYNLEFEVEYVTAEAKGERKSLVMNSGDLPDMIVNFSLSTSEIVKYGQEEGLFLPIEEYLSEELTPGLMYYKDVLDQYCTTPDGHVYTLPMMNYGLIDGGNYSKYFVNEKFLKDHNLELPNTLDEFVDAMYAIKEANPDMYPMGGGMDNRGNGKYILQALGYMTNNNYGLGAAIRDGEVVIPAYDVEVYQEYLKIMNKFYEDGIITPDYFTIGGVEADAMVVDGTTIVHNSPVYTAGVENWADWVSLKALTSDWQTEPEVPTPTVCTIGDFVISADTEYPELCVRFADIFFNFITDQCSAVWGGVPQGSEYAFEDQGYVMNRLDNGVSYRIFPEDLPEEYAKTGSSFNYMLEVLYGYLWNFGAYDTYECLKSAIKEWYDVDLGETIPRNYETYADHQYRWSIENTLIQYAAETFPSIYYVDEATANRITDLASVVNPYAKEQIALFITGQRPLEEVSAFAEELKGMGMDELLQIYTDVYSNR